MNLLSFNRNRIGGTLHFVAGKRIFPDAQGRGVGKEGPNKGSLVRFFTKDRQGKGGAGLFHVDGSHVGVKSPVFAACFHGKRSFLACHIINLAGKMP